MNIQKIVVVYFSPTGGVEKAARIVAGELAQRLGCQPDSVRMALTRSRRAVITELERRQGHEPARTVERAVRG